MTDRPWLSRYDPGVPDHLEYPPMPVFHFLDEAARLCPERPCTIFRGEMLTYQQVAEISSRIASRLGSLDVRKGERIGICMPNCPEFVMAYFGILKAGAAVVAINPLYTPTEIIRQANDAGLGKVFCSESLYERIKIAQPETGIRQVIVSGMHKPKSGDLRFDELLNAAACTPAAVTTEDTALFQYTGGTTGIPKAAIARHRNLVANALQFKAWMSTLHEEQETFLLALPIYHIYGMVCGMLLGMAMRASLVIIQNPRDIPELLSAIQTHHVTYFPAAPTLYNAINNAADVAAGKVNLTSIKACISGSAPLMKATKDKFENLTGGRIVEGYGLSEAPTATHCNPLCGENRIGSIGLPLPDVDARILDPRDGLRDMPVGQPGELVLQSPQVMQGYHNMPEETALAIRAGWLYTGDLACMDQDGYFYIIDRKKELIKPGGMEVWPREVEEAISTHPAVAEVAVAGIPEAYRGETVKAWVVLKKDETLTAAEIQTWCRKRLAAFKVPTEVEFRIELPKSAMGKILKRELIRQQSSQPG